MGITMHATDAVEYEEPIEPLPIMLRAMRGRRNITKEEASELIGISRGCLIDLEYGRRVPRHVTLRKIANGYGVPLGDLGEARLLWKKTEGGQGVASRQVDMSE